jgi:hypothetical protein
MWRFKISFLSWIVDTPLFQANLKNNAARLFEIAWQSIGVSNNGNSKSATAEGKSSAPQKILNSWL